MAMQKAVTKVTEHVARRSDRMAVINSIDLMQEALRSATGWLIKCKFLEKEILDQILRGVELRDEIREFPNDAQPLQAACKELIEGLRSQLEHYEDFTLPRLSEAIKLGQEDDVRALREEISQYAAKIVEVTKKVEGEYESLLARMRQVKKGGDDCSKALVRILTGEISRLLAPPTAIASIFACFGGYLSPTDNVRKAWQFGGIAFAFGAFYKWCTLSALNIFTLIKILDEGKLVCRNLSRLLKQLGDVAKIAPNRPVNFQAAQDDLDRLNRKFKVIRATIVEFENKNRELDSELDRLRGTSRRELLSP